MVQPTKKILAKKPRSVAFFSKSTRYPSKDRGSFHRVHNKPRFSPSKPRYYILRLVAVLYAALNLRMTAVFSDAVRRGFIYHVEVENDRGID